MPQFAPAYGGCLCGQVRFEVIADPLTLYACHCSDCQTSSGSSFTLILVVEPKAIVVREGEVKSFERSRADGRTKTIFRCPKCLSSLWGQNPRNPAILSIYAGTLDESCNLVPVGHIWTKRAQPWIAIPPGELNFEEHPPDFLAFVRAWQLRLAENGSAA